MSDLRIAKAGVSAGDSADLAFDSGSEEVTSQLAELESRELSQIERALARMATDITWLFTAHPVDEDYLCD